MGFLGLLEERGCLKGSNITEKPVPGRQFNTPESLLFPDNCSCFWNHGWTLWLIAGAPCILEALFRGFPPARSQCFSSERIAQQQVLGEQLRRLQFQESKRGHSGALWGGGAGRGGCRSCLQPPDDFLLYSNQVSWPVCWFRFSLFDGPESHIQSLLWCTHSSQLEGWASHFILTQSPAAPYPLQPASIGRECPIHAFPSTHS